MKSTGKVPKATICYWTQEDIEEEGKIKKVYLLQPLIDYMYITDMIFVDFPDILFGFFKFSSGSAKMLFALCYELTFVVLFYFLFAN